MSQAAKITSVDSVQLLKTALLRFTGEISVALGDLDLEAQRAVRWLQRDCKQYWTHQVQSGWERVAQARQQLERCLMFTGVAGQRPTCYDERKALAKAKHNLDVAQEKLEAVRHWSRMVDREVREFRGAINQLTGWVQIDGPRAAALLDRMTAALEQYLALKPATPDTDQASAVAAILQQQMASVGRGEETSPEAAPPPDQASSDQAPQATANPAAQASPGTAGSAPEGRAQLSADPAPRTEEPRP